MVARAWRREACGIVDDSAAGIDGNARERMGADRQAEGGTGERRSVERARGGPAAGTSVDESRAVAHGRMGAAATVIGRGCRRREEEERRVFESFPAR